MRRALAPLVASALVLLAGCLPGIALEDGGGGRGTDASAFDGGEDRAAPDAGGIAGSIGIEGLPATAESSSRFLDATGASLGVCFGEGGSPVCDPATCGSVRSCCVDDGTCCSALDAPPTPDTVDVTACADGAPARDCLPTAWVFGAPEPWVTLNGIAPGGDDTGDSGLALGEPVDLATHRLVLEGTFVPATSCTGGCVESVALGVTAQDAIASTVRPTAALVLSGSRRRMSFVVGDVTVDRWDDVMPSETWTLDLQPTGVAVVGREGLEAARAPIARERNAHAVLYGRTLNSTSPPTRVRDIHVRTTLCDMTDAFRDRGPLTVRAMGGALLTGELRAPSVAVIDGTSTLAMVIDGEIYVATDPGATGEHTTTTPTPLLTATNLDMGAGVMLDDPELVRSGAGTRLLFFTIRPTDGPSSLGVATLSDDLSTVIDGRPSIAGLGPGLEHATVHAHEPSRELVLVARESDSVATRLVVFRSDDEAMTFTQQETANLGAVTERGLTTGNLPTFDADEVGHPSLTVHDGAWHLGYAGRNGTRWAIGTLVSDDLVWWRELHERDGVFVSSRGSEDVVGVTEPDILVTPAQLELVYVGLDGVTSQLLRAVRTLGVPGTR